MYEESFIHYKIHIEIRDAEHKILFDTMQSIIDMIRLGETSEVKETLQRFIRLGNEHFASEEAFMESINYPYLNVHKSIHNSLRVGVEVLAARFENDYIFNEYYRTSLINTLRDFDKRMANHVDEDDRQYAEFYLKNK